MEDNKKIDLGKVVCDNYCCAERSERTICYFENYQNCVRYKTKKEYDNKDRDKRN